MADINITTDFTEVNNLNTALKSTGSLFVKVVDSLTREEARAKRVTKKLADTTQQNLDLIEKAEAIVAAKVQQESDKREKARTREATRAEKEAQRIVAATEKIVKAEAKLAAEVARNQAASAQRSTAGLNQRLGVTGTPASGAGAGFGALEGEIERLRLKYDQIYASSQLYEKSLMELNRANMLGVTSAKQHESAVEALNQEYQNFQNGIGGVGNRFTQHVNQTSTGMNKMGVVAQQTGYQVSDLFVQIQGGTNPLVAFSQQATQMAGLLYLLPPALQASTYSLFGFKIALSTVFAGVTILIPLVSMLAMAFFNSGKEAKEAADGPIKEAEDRIRSLDSALKDYLLTKKAASLGVTKDELISSTGLDEAIAALDAADKKLKQAQENASRRSATGFAPGSSTGSSLYSLLTLSNAEAELAAAQEARAKAAETLRLVEERTVEAYNKQYDALFQTHELELARLNLGEDSLAFKEKEAEADRRSYEERLRSSGELNASQVAGLVALYRAQQEAIKARQSELVVTENQRKADAARAQERLAVEREFASKRKQYFVEQYSEMAKIRKESDNFVKILNLGAVKKDAEGFNKAIEDALAAGVKFSLVDLSTIVALAAKNGWNLAASLQAAYAAATQAQPSAASVLTGAGGRPEVNLNDMQYRGAVIQGRVAIGQKAARDAAAAAGGTAGSAGVGAEPRDIIGDFQKQLDLERELVGTSEAYQKVRQALGDDFKTTSPVVIAGLVQQATETQRLIDLDNQRKDLMNTVKSSMEDAFMSMVDGTKSAKEAFKSMAAEIIKELYRVLVVQRLVSSISGALMPAAAPAGSVAPPPRPPGLATGGSMMANRAYMVGENGPELVIPRHSGSVVNANQTANAMGGSGNFTQNLSINVTGSDATMVRTEVAKMIPQITNATKAAVIDARLRGGQMKQAFR